MSSLLIFNQHVRPRYLKGEKYMHTDIKKIMDILDNGQHKWTLTSDPKNGEVTIHIRKYNNEPCVKRILFDGLDEAKQVLANMNDVLITYGYVTIGDFYDLAGVDAKYTDNKWGWVNLSKTKLVETPGGHVEIAFPTAISRLHTMRW